MESYWLIIVLVIVVPAFFWLRVRTFNKRKNELAVRCPHCEADQYLSEVKNYQCQQCKEQVFFFDNQGNALPDVRYYSCPGCGEENYVGVLTCQGCGLSSSASIPG